MAACGFNRLAGLYWHMLPIVSFVIFGWPRRTKEYGAAYPHRCPRCDNNSLFYLWASRRWLSLFFIPVVPLARRRFWLTCEVCGGGYKLSRSDAAAAKPLVGATRAYADGRLSRGEYTTQLRAFETEMWPDDRQFETTEIDPSHTSDRHCPQCSAPVEPGHEFCPQCGTTLDTPDWKETHQKNLDRRKQRSGK